MNARSIRVALAVAACAAAACSLIVKPSEAPRYCEGPDADCGAGYRCDSSGEGQPRCVPVCATDAQCLADFPALPYCRLEDGECVQCREDGHCASAERPICMENTCTAGCRVDGQCVDPTRPHCSEPVCVECTLNDHCQAGEACRGNQCVTGCDGPGDCPEGQQCVDGACLEPRAELCNNLDDDLDGSVDEDFDRDGDGFSSCSYVSQPPDCNDSAPAAYPGAQEICDQLDNNCDGEFNEGFLCPDGQVCNPTLGSCVDTECTEDAECLDPTSEFCHSDGICYPRHVGFGEACVVDGQCGATLQCVATDPLGRPGSYCVRACCNQADCGAPDDFCADNGTGLKVCVPNDWFPSGAAGCGGCRGSCVTIFLSLCIQQCCGDADCSGGSCQLTPATTPLTSGDEVPSLVCDVWTGPGPYEEIYCGLLALESCRSELMWRISSDRCICASPCCNDSDCRTADHDGARCAVDPNGYQSCYDPALLGPLGAGALGAACDPLHGTRDCASGVCHPERYCTEACCPGGTCSDGSYTCRPVRLGSGRTANLCAQD